MLSKTPSEVHILIDRAGWTVTQMQLKGEPYNVYPSQHGIEKQAKWAIGPIEVARILERLGIRVHVTVERSV